MGLGCSVRAMRCLRPWRGHAWRRPTQAWTGAELKVLAAVRCVPIAAVVVFGFGGLVALAVAVSLYLGLWSATKNTGLLLQEQTDTLLDTVKERIDSRLQPVVEQAKWIAAHLAEEDFDVNDQETLDAFMFGALAASPQVRWFALVSPSGRSRRWDRARNVVLDEDWSSRLDIRGWLREGETLRAMAWQAPLWAHTTGGTVVLHDAPLWRNGEFLGMPGRIVPIENLSAGNWI